MNRANRNPAPIVIAHRGASGYLPEHTLAAYFVAIQQGADYIEPDLVMTKDGVLVVRHENEISATTDVANHPEFASRRRRNSIDDTELEGWFTEDFTLAELKTLRVRERIPELRPANSRFDDQFTIATFDEVLALVQGVNRSRLRPTAGVTRARRPPIGVYPETKHPSHFDALGLSMDDALLRALRRYGYRSASAPVFIQSFETANLRRLSARTRLPKVFLVEENGAPFDLRRAGDARGYRDLVSPAGLAEVATFANAIGVHKNLLIPRDGDGDGRLGRPSSLAADARAGGLGVHAWTFRAENHFLPVEFRRGVEPAAIGDLAGEIRRFLSLGIDGVFCDHPDIARSARDAFRLERERNA